MSGEVSIWQMSEAELLARVVRLCDERGIKWVHIDTPHHNKRRQHMTGFPDLFLCGPRRVAFRELKKQYMPKTSPDQTTWKYALLAADQDYGQWQPSDLQSGRIEHELDRLCS